MEDVQQKEYKFKLFAFEALFILVVAATVVFAVYYEEIAKLMTK